MKNLLLVVLSSLLLVSCGLETKKYYFELENFETPQVYVLTCEEDPTRTQYWEMYSDLDKQTLTTVSYDDLFEKTAVMVEKYNETGAELTSFVLCGTQDGIYKEDEHELLETDVMLWSVKDDPFSYRVRSSGVFGETMEMVRERTYFARAHMDVMGEKYEVLGFKDAVTYVEANVTFENRKYYGEGIGILAMEYEENGVQYVLKLTAILSPEEWQKLKGN